MCHHSNNDSGTELVTEVLDCLKQQLQDDRSLAINAIEPRNDGTRPANVGNNHVDQFFDGLTGAPLGPELVSLAKIKEVEFLHTFFVYEKVDESEDRSKEFVSTRWILMDKGDASTIC